MWSESNAIGPERKKKKNDDVLQIDGLEEARERRIVWREKAENSGISNGHIGFLLDFWSLNWNECEPLDRES